MSEQELQKVIDALKVFVKDREKQITSTAPKKVFYHPAALAAAGLTHEDVVKLAMGKTDA
jgi:hypothetical protein